MEEDKKIDIADTLRGILGRYTDRQRDIEAANRIKNTVNLLSDLATSAVPLASPWISNPLQQAARNASHLSQHAIGELIKLLRTRRQPVVEE